MIIPNFIFEINYLYLILSVPPLSLDFFDRCANPSSLLPLRGARKRCPRLNRRFGFNLRFLKKRTGIIKNDTCSFGAEGGI